MLDAIGQKYCCSRMTIEAQSPSLHFFTGECIISDAPA
jgi:DNA-directed RNA polymerase subunit N (RpoN/RPB10)